ncbi:preprotein translocase subunit YajC [Nonomuraea rhodomycinica]|uniref:Preprotein translocase subunit YajC n=1 Tax=Nonomuraea rhodomycinica TaxID=1712872 RepID=A0A7Y6MG26_9ACTN|nr:preprotein translocase subunit YajC [Nonomuraea rhodomycinica]NUW45635.1 preprotein translocase subunit YajC [Nonomuraea rhodomycinica]
MNTGQLTSILPLILLVVVFYFLLIRPQRKRQQEAAQMQNSLTPGARVMTTTGLFGTVVAVENEDVVLEVAPGIETRWVKAAIGRVVTPGEPVADEPPADDVSDAVETDKDGTTGTASERNDGQDTTKS